MNVGTIWSPVFIVAEPEKEEQMFHSVLNAISSHYPQHNISSSLENMTAIKPQNSCEMEKDTWGLFLGW